MAQLTEIDNVNISVRSSKNPGAVLLSDKDFILSLTQLARALTFSDNIYHSIGITQEYQASQS